MVNNNWWGDTETRFFFELTPDRVIQAIESAGFLSTGRCLTLNSFENRVYEVELDPESPGFDVTAKSPSARYRIAKFYRPGRWSQEQILEEHRFLLALQADEIPAIAPLLFSDGATLRQEPSSGIWFSLFPKVGGRSPDEMTDEQMRRIGRLLARIHTVGAREAMPLRLRLNSETYGRANLSYLQATNLDPRFLDRLTAASEKLIGFARELVDPLPAHRIHGDCHPGNLLWNDQGPFFLDFDDCVTGPAVQDFWLLLPGRPADNDEGDPTAKERLRALIEGYTELRDFDHRQIKAIEVLRGLRLLHFAAWIGRRWEDPSFPKAFPQYGTERYWDELCDDLEEQARLTIL